MSARRNRIYLDNSATTRTDPCVQNVIQECWDDFWGNPASQHLDGQRANHRLAEARQQLCELLGAADGGIVAEEPQLIVTSGGTEANNLAITGLARQSGEILISAVEHPSVLMMQQVLERVRKIPVDSDGRIRLDWLADHLTADTALVSVMWGNNETGVLQPIQDIARLCSEHDVPFHSDGVQAIGKLPCDFNRSGIAALSISAHKFHGPVGIGGLLVAGGVSLTPLLRGGFQQLGLRAGTEPVAETAGMAAALHQCVDSLAEDLPRMVKLRDRLERNLRAEISSLIIHGEEVDRLPHITNVSLPGVDRQAFLMALDFAGIACSSGSACASGSSEPSHVLQEMGLSQDLIGSALRFSLSRHTTAEEIDQASERILHSYNDLAQRRKPQKGSASARGAGSNPL